LPKFRSEDETESTEQRVDTNIKSEKWNPSNLVHGLNFYLTRLPSYPSEEDGDPETRHDTSISSDRSPSQRSGSSAFHFNNTIRILSASSAPNIRVPNHNYDPNLPEDDSNPKDLPWDVRFTATRRTYAYRILHSCESWEGGNEGYLSACHHSYPFEHDRVWRIHEKRTKNKTTCTDQSSSLDIAAMNHAGKYLTGTHDFTSFRGKGCQRSSPIVTIDDVWCGVEKYHGEFGEGILNAVSRKSTTLSRNASNNPWEDNTLHTPDALQLVTIVIRGKSFLYHQVRNMVACLVEVGRGKLTPDDVKRILEQKNRASALGMAPAHGLFLVDVEHGDFRF
jgi:tRNA pseudouridine38-40 synthase